MSEDSIGYIQVPKNGNGITRSRTTAQIRAWMIERSLKQLDRVNKEWGGLEFPSIYILFEKKKVYIGEAKSVYDRIKTHINSPDKKIKNWDSVLIINDGRPASQSDFNDGIVRRYIEDYLVKLFKLNKYNTVSQSSPQQVNSIQKTIVDNLIIELNFFLQKENLISKLFPDIGEEEVHIDELKKILINKRKSVEKWSAYSAIIDGEKVFIRPGSPKTKGWQITFRDKFKTALKNGKGSLLVPRSKVLLIPFIEIQKAITDPMTYNQNTIDVYIKFTDESISLSYKQQTIDVSQYCLI